MDGWDKVSNCSRATLRNFIHLRFHQTEARLQQEAVGIMGVNLVYGAFYNHDEPKKIIKHLDHIDKTAIEIDTINFSGPVFDGLTTAF